MPFDLTVNKAKNPMNAKRAAMEAAKASASGASGAGTSAALMKYKPPAECAERIRVVFDDSGSMSSEIDNAKAGVVEFLRNCIPNQTAVAVHFMCTTSWSTTLRSDLPQLGADITEAVLSLKGTPFFNTLKCALEATPAPTRVIAFTDGSPTDELQAEEVSDELQGYYRGDRWTDSAKVIIAIAKAVATAQPALKLSCIPIDTVYFGAGTEWERRQMDLLRYLSEATGGYFLHFDPAKVNFRTAFKYLAPVNRLQLSSGSFRAELESGRKS